MRKKPPPPQRPGAIGWLKNARANVASRRPTEVVRTIGDDIRSRLPALSQGADFVSDMFAGAGSGGLLRMSFFAAVLAPTALYFLYAALWETPRYVAETRLTVREASKKDRAAGGDAASSIMAKITGGGGGSKDTQNTFIVLNYVKSRALLLDLGGRAYFERKYARSGVDYFSRLRGGATVEELWKYWLNHVSATVDTLSGILTVRIDAFEPKDALVVANDVIRLSENLINQITLRNRTDELSRAESEVALSRQKLAEARERVLQFRNQNYLIDPGSRASSISEMVAKLTMERIDLVNALSTASISLSADAPSLRLQKSRLASVDAQIAELKKKLTDTQGVEAVSTQIAAYERLKLEEQFAERLYTISQTAFERAREDLLRQQLYLITVVTPTLPEDPAYPRVFGSTLLVFGAFLVVWSVVVLIAATIEEQIV